MNDSKQKTKWLRRSEELRARKSVSSIFNDAAWLAEEADAGRLELGDLAPYLAAQAGKLSTLVEKIQNGEI